MKFEPYPLGAPLNESIELLFHYSHFMPDHSVERVVPTGHVHLIFELDGFERFTYKSDGKTKDKSFKNVWISGMHKNHISISAHENSEMLVVQFKPHSAFAFLHQSMHELNEKIIDAEEILGSEIIELRNRIVTIENPTEKLATVAEWLTNQFDTDKAPSSDLIEIIGKFQTSSVSEFKTIVADYPKSQKHLIDQFKKYVGLTPKLYQRILRFNEILQRIHQSEKIEWSQIAYQCEYADQSHFIKEFKLFSGLNPEKFIQNDFHNVGQNFFPLDREG